MMVKSEMTIKARARCAGMVAATGGARPIFITDAARAPAPEAVIRGLPAGAIVICRDYSHPHRAALARKLRRLTRLRRQLLLIAADARLARMVGADGVHLQEHCLIRPPALAGFKFITAACHSRRALCRATVLGVDLALVSPVFATRSHPDTVPLGLHRFSRLVARAPLPVAALGGVNIVTAKKLKPLKPAAFAAIDGFLS